MSDFSNFVTNPGSRVRDVFVAKVDPYGNVDLEKVGEESIYDLIQSYRDSTDLNKLLQRYRNGEVDVLQRVQGVFGDFSKLPKTYAELLQLQIDAKNLFDSLPIDLQQKFTFDEFLGKAGSKDWFEKLGVSIGDSLSAETFVNEKGSDSE